MGLFTLKVSDAQLDYIINHNLKTDRFANTKENKAEKKTMKKLDLSSDAKEGSLSMQ